jgi:hypothetical protein
MVVEFVSPWSPENCPKGTTDNSPAAANMRELRRKSAKRPEQYAKKAPARRSQHWHSGVQPRTQTGSLCSFASAMQSGDCLINFHSTDYFIDLQIAFSLRWPSTLSKCVSIPGRSKNGSAPCVLSIMLRTSSPHPERNHGELLHCCNRTSQER